MVGWGAYEKVKTGRKRKEGRPGKGETTCNGAFFRGERRKGSGKYPELVIVLSRGGHAIGEEKIQ